MRARWIAMMAVALVLGACGSSGPGDPGGGQSGEGAGYTSSFTGFGTGAGFTGSGTTSSGFTGSGTTSSGVTSSGGDGPEAICKKVAAKTIDCCPPGVANCAPDTESGWVSFCLQFYDSCPATFQCEANSSSCDSDCPTFASGC